MQLCLYQDALSVLLRLQTGEIHLSPNSDTGEHSRVGGGGGRKGKKGTMCRNGLGMGRFEFKSSEQVISHQPALLHRVVVKIKEGDIMEGTMGGIQMQQ